MSDPKVEEIRARLAAATPGPWCHYPEAGTIEIAEGGDEVHSGAILVSSVRPRLGWGAEIYTGDEPDAEFIANAPTDIALLLTKLDEAEKERDAAYLLGMASASRKLDEAERQKGLWQSTNAETLIENARFRAKLASAEERERALITGIREEITKVIEDLDRARANGTVYTYGNIQTRLRHALSRLLPSTPTEEGKSHE